MFKTLKDKIKAHLTYSELKSIFQTFLAFGAAVIIAIDLLPQLQAVLNGDWSKPTLFALGVAVFRSIIKVGWTMLVVVAKNSQP